MAKKKYYAVRKGRKPGIYFTWDETTHQVYGYKNAEYKSFTSLEEAEQFMRSGNSFNSITSKKKSNKTKKYYAVKQGREPGIYNTWEDAHEQILNYKNAMFKSFSSEEEAEDYLEGRKTKNEKVNDFINQQIKALDSDTVLAFVDGSFSDSINGEKRYSFGAILVTDKGEKILYGSYNNADKIDLRNIAGELKGVKEAVLWAIKNDRKNIKVFYDYCGIERWGKGEWSAKNKTTQSYYQFIQEKLQLINIDFYHVESHTGIDYNERVDEIAKNALYKEVNVTYLDI